jgi:hypothetical protein
MPNRTKCFLLVSVSETTRPCRHAWCKGSRHGHGQTDKPTWIFGSIHRAAVDADIAPVLWATHGRRVIDVVAHCSVTATVEGMVEAQPSDHRPMFRPLPGFFGVLLIREHKNTAQSSDHCPSVFVFLKELKKTLPNLQTTA